VAGVAPKGEKTLFCSVLLSGFGPAATGLALMVSRSSTQFADFLRRTLELMAVIVSWAMLRSFRTQNVTDEREKARRSQIASRVVGAAMLVSGAAMLYIAIWGAGTHKDKGNVIPGLTVAFLGFLTNVFFWIRYRSLVRREPSPIIAAQVALYRAKSLTDLCVLGALGTVAAAPLHPLAGYIDRGGGFTVALFLLWNGVSVVQKARFVPLEEAT